MTAITIEIDDTLQQVIREAIGHLNDFVCSVGDQGHTASILANSLLNTIGYEVVNLYRDKIATQPGEQSGND